MKFSIDLFVTKTANLVVAAFPDSMHFDLNMSDSVRADKWLWATRFFKTRSMAGEKCTDGKVRRNGHLLKPASPVQAGDLLEIPFPEGPGQRRIKVKILIVKRVGAPQAQACYEDLTAPEVHQALREWHLARLEAPKGRPTKKDRRDIDRIHGFWDREPG